MKKFIMVLATLMLVLQFNCVVFAASTVSFSDAIEAGNPNSTVSFANAVVVPVAAPVAATRTANPPKAVKEKAVGKYIGTFTATAYDNYHGDNRTALGISIKGKTLEEARMISVDPKVIPLGSQVYLQFPAPYTHLNGTYTAGDTGGVVKGNIIDIFWGDAGVGVHDPSVFQFGRRSGVKAYFV